MKAFKDSYDALLLLKEPFQIPVEDKKLIQIPVKDKKLKKICQIPIGIVKNANINASYEPNYPPLILNIVIPPK